MPKSAKRYPSFHFQVADVINGAYNPGVSHRAAEHVFPYPDAAFDVALATSLFTHLKPFESERYQAETARTQGAGWSGPGS